jgi:DNA-binding LacI/PurR family transcriptional regulator
MSENGTDNYVVDVDNIESARVATRYLIDHGRKRIATIAGPQDMAAGLDRFEGWKRTLEAGGLRADLYEVGDFTPTGGGAAMARLLERGVPFDAVFVASDQMASGALGVLREHGISVPHDVAVVGFDNDYFSTTSTPPLTTIAQPSVALGSRMAEILVRLISGGTAERLTIMPTVLVERESV